MEMESGNESDDDRNTDPLDLSNHKPSLNSRVDEMTHCNGESSENIISQKQSTDPANGDCIY